MEEQFISAEHEIRPRLYRYQYNILLLQELI
jgi:hypothetical protein